MLPYFPVQSDKFTLTMDAQARLDQRIVVDTEWYALEIALKQAILTAHHDYHFQCPPAALPLAWETLEVLLPDMAATLPQHFGLETTGSRAVWTNRLAGTQTAFVWGKDQTLPLSPLDWLGRQIQEDLILLSEGADGETFVAAGQLCFASGWCLGEKMGRSFLETHDIVPGFREQVGKPADLLMRRLKPDRPVSRLNWSITTTDQLNLAPRLAAQWHPTRQGITPENAGKRTFFRVERQTLTRLPRTRGILFTIHTYLNPLGEVVADPARARRLTAVLRSYPEALKDYKGMHAYYDALMKYLETSVG